MCFPKCSSESVYLGQMKCEKLNAIIIIIKLCDHKIMRFSKFELKNRHTDSPSRKKKSHKDKKLGNSFTLSATFRTEVVTCVCIFLEVHTVHKRL